MMWLAVPGRRFRSDLMRDAAVTFGAVVLAVAALDDITTDTATSFVFERLALALCGAWLLLVTWRLLRSGHRVLGAVSAVAVAAAAASQPAIGPGLVPSFRPAYVATVAGVLWFTALAGALATIAVGSIARGSDNPSLR